MDLNWLESVIYGLISGFTEFLPISSAGHQQLLLNIFGAQGRDPVRDLLVHLTMLYVIYSCCRSAIDNIRRDRQQRHNRRNPVRSTGTLMDYRLVKNAAIPMIVGILILSYIVKSNWNLLLTSVFLLLNGIILFISGRVLQGNKDARSMSMMDSLLVGTLSSLSVLPGISRVGCATSVSVIRGSDRQYAFNWALLLSIPALFMLSGLDILGIFSTGNIPFWKSFFTYILSVLGTYIGGYYGISLMRFLAVRTGFSIFSYYCWGASLLTFLLYLTVA